MGGRNGIRELANMKKNHNKRCPLKDSQCPPGNDLATGLLNTQTERHKPYTTAASIHCVRGFGRCSPVGLMRRIVKYCRTITELQTTNYSAHQSAGLGRHSVTNGFFCIGLLYIDDHTPRPTCTSVQQHECQQCLNLR